MSTAGIPVRIAATEETYSVTVETGGAIEARPATAIQIVDGEHYEGPTEIIPTGEEQILRTAGLVVGKDITVGAIPNNYGLIGWNGSALTVS